MEEVVISLLAPVAPQRVQRWVEEQVDGLRAHARAGGLRLGRLARSTPAQGGDWLITVDREHRSVALEHDVALASILTGLAIMGLRPCLFVISKDPGARRSRDAHGAGVSAGITTGARATPGAGGCRGSRARRGGPRGSSPSA
jgi:hypothetical protein